MTYAPLDPLALPPEPQARHQLSRDLIAKSAEALRRGAVNEASLCICDALMTDPNDREILNAFDDMALSQPQPLSLFPITDDSIHVATAAGRARVLMMERNLPQALVLMGAIFEVAPERPYFDWVRRWVSTPAAAELPWELWNESVVMPILRMLNDVPVPTPSDDPRVPNIRTSVEILHGLSTLFPQEPSLPTVASIALRRLGDSIMALRVAEEASGRFPEHWQLCTARLNALCDLGDLERALEAARRALVISPSVAAPLFDVAQAFLKKGDAPRALELLREVESLDPEYPAIEASLRFASFLLQSDASNARLDLLALRDRRPWDLDVRRVLDRVEAPQLFANVLVPPSEPLLGELRALLNELRTVAIVCGSEITAEVQIETEFPEAPSVRLAFEWALAQLKLPKVTVALKVQKRPTPKPGSTFGDVWADKAPVKRPTLRFDGAEVHKIYEACSDPRVQSAVAGLASQPFRRESWTVTAQTISEMAGPAAIDALLSVVHNPPPAPDEFDPLTWYFRCQVACAVIASHLGMADGEPGHAALLSLLSGPSDWQTVAAIVALGWWVAENPQGRPLVESLFGWLREALPREGGAPWEQALASVWLDLGEHAPPREQELRAWLGSLSKTYAVKNAVRVRRRYRGLSLEEYAAFVTKRDALDKQGAEPAALAELCQPYGIDPEQQQIEEWQEAMTANADLLQRFVLERQHLERFGGSSLR